MQKLSADRCDLSVQFVLLPEGCGTSNLWRALECKTPIHQIDPANKSDVERLCMSQEVDLILFYGWSWMVPDIVVAKRVCMCLHPSNVPLFRGGSPLQNQVFSGVTKSALTLLRMNESVDAGPMFGQIPLDLKGSIEDLFVEMTRLGNRLTKRLIADCVSGDLRFHDQHHTLATEFKRRLPSDSELIPSTVKKWRFEELEE